MTASGKESNFIDEYEAFVTKVAEEHLGREEDALVNALKEKRSFGLQKYGDISFQSSLQNAMQVDTLQHAREELIDYMNYTIHEVFKHSRTGDIKLINKDLGRLERAVKLYRDTK